MGKSHNGATDMNKDMKELVVALIDHGFEINLMSMNFYKKHSVIRNR